MLKRKPSFNSQEELNKRGRRKASGPSRSNLSPLGRNTALFGAVIEPRSKEIPLVVEKCVKYIEEKAIKKEGIFRISGRQNEILSLKDQYDSGAPVDLNNTDDWHAVTGLLKLYFREMIEPLLTYKRYTAFLKIGNSSDPVAQMDDLRKVIETLPPFNYNLLQYLLRFLFKVSKYSEYNKMTSTNLAIIFAPCLLKKKNEVLLQVVQDTPAVTKSVKLLIDFYESIKTFELKMDGDTQENMVDDADRLRKELEGKMRQTRSQDDLSFLSRPAPKPLMSPTTDKTSQKGYSPNGNSGSPKRPEIPKVEKPTRQLTAKPEVPAQAAKPVDKSATVKLDPTEVERITREKEVAEKRIVEKAEKAAKDMKLEVLYQKYGHACSMFYKLLIVYVERLEKEVESAQSIDSITIVTRLVNYIKRILTQSISTDTDFKVDVELKRKERRGGDNDISVSLSQLRVMQNIVKTNLSQLRKRVTDLQSSRHEALSVYERWSDRMYMALKQLGHYFGETTPQKPDWNNISTPKSKYVSKKHRKKVEEDEDEDEDEGGYFSVGAGVHIPADEDKEEPSENKVAQAESEEEKLEVRSEHSGTTSPKEGAKDEAKEEAKEGMKEEGDSATLELDIDIPPPSSEAPEFDNPAKMIMKFLEKASDILNDAKENNSISVVTSFAKFAKNLKAVSVEPIGVPISDLTFEKLRRGSGNKGPASEHEKIKCNAILNVAISIINDVIIRTQEHIRVCQTGEDVDYDLYRDRYIILQDLADYFTGQDEETTPMNAKDIEARMKELEESVETTSPPATRMKDSKSILSDMVAETYNDIEIDTIDEEESAMQIEVESILESTLSEIDDLMQRLNKAKNGDLVVAIYKLVTNIRKIMESQEVYGIDIEEFQIDYPKSSSKGISAKTTQIREATRKIINSTNALFARLQDFVETNNDEESLGDIMARCNMIHLLTGHFLTDAVDDEFEEVISAKSKSPFDSGFSTDIDMSSHLNDQLNIQLNSNLNSQYSGQLNQQLNNQLDDYANSPMGRNNSYSQDLGASQDFGYQGGAEQSELAALVSELLFNINTMKKELSQTNSLKVAVSFGRVSSYLKKVMGLDSVENQDIQHYSVEKPIGIDATPALANEQAKLSKLIQLATSTFDSISNQLSGIAQRNNPIDLSKCQFLRGIVQTFLKKQYVLSTKDNMEVMKDAVCIIIQETQLKLQMLQTRFGRVNTQEGIVSLAKTMVELQKHLYSKDGVLDPNRMQIRKLSLDIGRGDDLRTNPKLKSVKDLCNTKCTSMFTDLNSILAKVDSFDYEELKKTGAKVKQLQILLEKLLE